LTHYVVAPRLSTPPKGVADLGALSSLKPLHRFLTRTDRHDQVGDFEQIIWSLFGLPEVQGDVPLAALRYQQESSLPLLNADQQVMLLDWLYLKHDQDRLLGFRLPADALTHEQLASLVAYLNDFLQEDGLKLCVGEDQQCYVISDSIWHITTSPARQVEGRNVDLMMPKGADALRFKKLLNELQMLLHQWPENQQREFNGKVTVSSPWVSFVSQAEAIKPVGFQQLGASPLWIQQLQHKASQKTEHKLSVFTDLMDAEMQSDAEAWWLAAQRFNTWLAQQALSDMVLFDADGSRFEHYNAWRWWRRYRAK
jgi:hypothetical protein